MIRMFSRSCDAVSSRVRSLGQSLARNWKSVLGNVIVSLGVGAAPFLLVERDIVVDIPKPLFAAILFMAMVALFYILSMRRRLQQIQTAIHLFEEGNFEQRLRIGDVTQLSGIALSFNAMADRIVSNIAALKEHERLRSELLTNVSHDLRSPLTAIQGYIETVMLKEDSISPKQRREYLEIVIRNTTSLIQLIDELFELSKLDEKGIISSTPFSIAGLVESLALRYGAGAEEKGIRLSVQVPELMPEVLGEEKLIERAIGNIVQNAIYYTPEEGQIRLELSRKKGAVEISVQDTGIGIPEDALPHVFERFYRVDKDRSKKTGGSGLGLAITKRIIEAHQGELKIDSRVGEGTRVSFRLPAVD